MLSSPTSVFSSSSSSCISVPSTADPFSYSGLSWRQKIKWLVVLLERKFLLAVFREQLKMLAFQNVLLWKKAEPSLPAARCWCVAEQLAMAFRCQFSTWGSGTALWDPPHSHSSLPAPQPLSLQLTWNCFILPNHDFLEVSLWFLLQCIFPN